MTEILQMILQSQGGNASHNLAQRFGVSDAQANSAIGALLPALLNGVQNNVGQQGGLEGLLGALAGGRHERYVDEQDSLYQQETIQDGNGILGHLLGSKDVSRQVATQASAQTGIGSDILKQMLPVVATMLMGSLSKQTQRGTAVAAGASGGPASFLSMLTPMLDQNNDGSAADDVLRMIGGLFRK